MTVCRFAFGLCGALLAGALSAAPARIEAIRVAEYDSKTRLVLELDRSRSHKLLVLDNQPRVVVDISSSAIHASLPERGTGIIRGMRHAQHQGGKLRVVFDLYASATAESITIAAAKAGERHRIVVDIYPGGENSEVAADTNQHPLARDVLVAIDPGHGGKDPGAIGRNGFYEKTAVLAISRRLARLIDAEPGMQAMLTRNGDYYLKLRSRYELARQRNADLFVSVHADAVRNRRVRGASVYVLSEKGSSDEARRLARRENAADLLGGIELDEYPPTVTSMIIDLQQNASIGASLEVGDDVLQHLHGVGQVRKSRVQKAPFAVLKAHDVPSILVETAYISNPQDERLLRTSAYQEQLARALLAGVRAYFYKNPPRGTLIAQQVAAGVVPEQRYVARRGDTLSGIAHRFKVPLRVLKRANNLPNDHLRVGQVLTIPAG
ncbi:N-acetylmuramoyl-L-alanine amidase [Candidatus Foliamicus sp.]